MINKKLLQEPNLIDLSKEIFKAVVRDKFEINTRFELLSQDIYEADNIPLNNLGEFCYNHLIQELGKNFPIEKIEKV